MLWLGVQGLGRRVSGFGEGSRVWDFGFERRALCMAKGL